ncbi:unnamed protein product [Paramecium octaurelia]|uniref:Uncharacterized protein n=1 Tax=Paramecium octaurelia TaxID=43137 RepID=A0A8S1YM87_PAROT|nr:unnamed protein product [Paramecium octaurelia]
MNLLYNQSQYHLILKTKQLKDMRIQSNAIAKKNEQVNKQDNDLIILDSKIYISGNATLNTNLFENYILLKILQTNSEMVEKLNLQKLVGWLKIVNALQNAQELSYQFRKMTTYQGQTQLFIENLATFELFYLISPFFNQKQ